MELDLDEFLVLLLRQLENYTTWEEDRYIDRMLQRHDLARELMEDVRETFPLQAKRHPYFVTDNPQLVMVKGLDPMRETAPAPIPQRKRRYLNLAAAALVAVIIMAFFLLPSREQLHVPATAGKGVILQLARGETIQLGDGEATIPTRDAMLSTNSAMLEFQAVPGSTGSKEQTIVVPAARMYSIKLADGTVVHMNAATSLRFPFAFNGNKREVYIDGEAYFSVAPDPRRPFIVHTKQGDVNILGTDFNINTYGSNFIVSLVSGSVIVQPKKGAQKQIKPCEETVLDPVSLELSLHEINSELLLGWLHGEYRFRLQPLADVCKAAERLYGVKIAFDDQQLATLKYSGTIDAKEPIGTFLEKLRYNRKEDEYYYDDKGVIHLKL
jgi:transmembrane sensor